MTVLRQRNEVSRALRRSLDTDAVIVSGPDHPLLVEAPDILVAEKGGLVAVYFPKAAEYSNPQRLYTRLVLARLALPPQTRHVLVHDHRKPRTAFSFEARSFAAVLSSRPRHIEELSKIARDPAFDGGHSQLPADVLISTRHRFAEALSMTKVIRRLSRSAKQANFGVQSRGTSGPYPIGAVGGRQGLVHEADISQRAWKSLDIQNLAVRTTRTAFTMDNGVPYPTDGARYGVVVIDEFRDFRGDPDKLVRAAAFAGWVLAPRNQKPMVPELIQRLQSRR